MGGAVFPPCWLSGLRYPSPGDRTPASWEWPGLGGKMAVSRRAHVNECDLPCAHQQWSFCSPLSCGVPLSKPRWPSKSNAPRAPPPDARPHSPPRLGSLMWDSEFSLLCENLCDIIIFTSLWGSYLAGMGFDFIANMPLLQSHCGSVFVFGYRISFLVDSSLFCWWLFSS